MPGGQGEDVHNPVAGSQLAPQSHGLQVMPSLVQVPVAQVTHIPYWSGINPGAQSVGATQRPSTQVLPGWQSSSEQQNPAMHVLGPSTVGQQTEPALHAVVEQIWPAVQLRQRVPSSVQSAVVQHSSLAKSTHTFCAVPPPQQVCPVAQQRSPSRLAPAQTFPIGQQESRPVAPPVQRVEQQPSTAQQSSIAWQQLVPLEALQVRWLGGSGFCTVPRLLVGQQSSSP